jgi:hypothetical protein
MKKIRLIDKVFTLIDSEDYSKIKDYTWRYNKLTGYAYKTRYAGRLRGQSKMVTDYLHRFILDVTDRNTQVDHINGDKLDNRRENIRTVTRSQNQQNRKLHRDGRPIGVNYYEYKGKKQVQARILRNGRLYWLGFWPNEEIAGEAYRFAVELFEEGIEPAELRQKIKLKLTY